MSVGNAQVDLLQLADIARDRSAQGRAKLFALLAALLCERWRDLTARERDLFADLLLALSPRAEQADRERLGRYLATRPDLPESLSLFAAPAEPRASAVSEPTPIHQMTADDSAVIATKLPAESDALDEAISDDENQAVDERGLADPGIGIQDMPEADRLASIDDRPSFATPSPGTSSVTQPKPVVTLPTVSAHVTMPRRQQVTVMVSQSVKISRAAGGPPPAARPDMTVKPQPSASVSAPISPVPLPGRLPNPFPPVDAPRMPEPVARKPDPSSEHVLTMPRDNPHLLTPELLGQVLDQDDLPRFEVMLAYLSGLRAPLLRRLLRDGGSEGFAIVARAAGFDAAGFVAQWQDWRRRQMDLGRASLHADSHDAKRIGDFFAALTDQQVDRLIKRWRSDGDRFFAGSVSLPEHQS